MKNKRQIEALAAEAGQVEVPKAANLRWEHFAAQLRDVVVENLPEGDRLGTRRSWDFDSYSGTFYFEVGRTQRIELPRALAQGRQRIGATMTFSLRLDPRAPLEAEVARVVAEVKAIDEALAQIRRSQLIALREAHGEAAVEEAVNA